MRAFELKFDGEFDLIFSGMNYAAPGGIAPQDAIKRWLVFGMARDFGKPAEDCATLINNLVRIERK